MDMLENENWYLNRCTKDKACANRHGNHLIEFCKALSHLIINGRLGRDKAIGDFARDDTTGRNIVDYMICNPELFSIIEDFIIEPKVSESDHRGLSIEIACKSHCKYNVNKNHTDWALHKRCKWSINDLPHTNVAIRDAQTKQHRQVVLDALADLKDSK